MLYYILTIFASALKTYSIALSLGFTVILIFLDRINFDKDVQLRHLVAKQNKFNKSVAKLKINMKTKLILISKNVIYMYIYIYIYINSKKVISLNK